MGTVPIGSDVEEPGSADSGIDDEALSRVPGAAEIGLQDVVDRNAGLFEIGDKVVKPCANAAWHIVVVGTGNRFQGIAIDELIAGEDRSIGWFSRIVCALIFCTGLRVGRNRGACDKK